MKKLTGLGLKTWGSAESLTENVFINVVLDLILISFFTSAFEE